MNRRRIKIKNKSIEYALRRQRGSRSVRLAIYPDGAFVVTAPKWYPVYIIKRFLEEKSDWIFEKLKNIDFKALANKHQAERIKYKEQKELARIIITERIKFFNRFYNFEYNRVSIKNQRTCWGSCSRKGNLNFNYKVASLSEDLRDYIIVHELCHLQELNHSKKFWNLIKIAIPEYKLLRKKLRNISKQCLGSKSA